ncbi:hypothetical protein PoMZ_08157 [Pyricularia oryzae]|uniref:Uncharacterized protein n=1 Tax=Pyricularia oryzae TaxID=318829 RepID=A0A4P7NGW6_PYROR|nr:hypothetical protein PoMZ_08157 [Pyricularia oryzae]
MAPPFVVSGRVLALGLLAAYHILGDLRRTDIGFCLLRQAKRGQGASLNEWISDMNTIMNKSYQFKAHRCQKAVIPFPYDTRTRS